MMAAPCLDADDLPAACRRDALLGGLVALDLRHPGLTILWLPVPGARTMHCFFVTALPPLVSLTLPRPNAPAPVWPPVRPPALGPASSPALRPASLLLAG